MGLLGFAAREIQLNSRESDGSTLREHIKQMQKSSGPDWWPDGFAPIECPPMVEYIWGYFNSLHARRKSGESFSFESLLAWANLLGIRLEKFELDALNALEVIYMHYYSKRTARAAEEAAEQMRRNHGRRH